MTAPVVGAVAVEIRADARGLARDLRKNVEAAFKGLDLGKAIRDAVGRTDVKVKVTPEFDARTIPEKVRQTRVPKVPVELDPVVAAFQQEVRRQTQALARGVSAKIPIEADGGGLRQDLSRQIAAVQSQLKAKIDIDADTVGYEQSVRGAVARLEAAVKAHIPAELDADGLIASARRAAKAAQAATPDVEIGVDVDRDMLGSLGGNLLSKLPQMAQGLQSIGSAASDAAGSAARLGGSLVGAVTTASGPAGVAIGAMIALSAAIAAVGAAITFTAPAVGLLGGALGALPGLVAGVGGAVATLQLGFSGLAAALHKMPSGGGGGGQDPASRARQIAAAERGVESARRGIAGATRGLESAERGLESARRNVTVAVHAETVAERSLADAQGRARVTQEAVSRARRDAKEDIEDLALALSGAKLSEERATRDMEQAARELEQAKFTENPDKIAEADLAYRESVQAVKEATDSVGDLTEQQQDAAKKGVDGSDRVVAAVKDEQDAQRGVADAQWDVVQARNGVIDANNGVIDAQNALASANDGLTASYDGLASAQDALIEAQKKAPGGGGGALSDVVKLAPNAQAFVKAIKDLKPAFDDLRLDVQNRLFAGLGETVKDLATAWRPTLERELGKYADTFNGFLINLGKSMSKPEFVNNMGAGMESVRQNIDKVGQKISGPLIEAFGRLAKAADPLIDAIGDGLAGAIQDFSDWIIKLDKEKKLDKFFETAAGYAHDLFDIAGDVFSIIGSILSIFFNADQDASKTPLEGIKNTLHRLAEAMKDPEFQDNAKKFVGFFVELAGAMSDVAALADKVENFVFRVKLGLEAAKTDLRNFVTGVGEFVGDTSTALLGKGADLVDGLIDGMRSQAQALGQRARELKTAVFNGIGTVTGFLSDKGVDLARGLGEGIRTQLSSLRTRAREVLTTIGNGVGNVTGFLTSRGRDLINGMINGIGATIGTLRAKAGSLGREVLNAVGNTANMLVDAGKNIVIGLWNGIASLGQWLRSKVIRWIDDNVPAPIAWALKINSPSKVAASLGESVPEGLALGIDRGSDAVADAATRIANSALPALDSSAFSMGSLALSSTINAPAPRMQLDWAPGANGDPVLDGFRNLIQVRYGGDVQTALGG